MKHGINHVAGAIASSPIIATISNLAPALNVLAGATALIPVVGEITAGLALVGDTVSFAASTLATIADLTDDNLNGGRLALDASQAAFSLVGFGALRNLNGARNGLERATEAVTKTQKALRRAAHVSKATTKRSNYLNAVSSQVSAEQSVQQWTNVASVTGIAGYGASLAQQNLPPSFGGSGSVSDWEDGITAGALT